MPGDRETSLAAGASDYVTKPVDLDELLGTIASWVGPRGADPGTGAAAAAAGSAGAADPEEQP
jgi:DNA-binding response OmpR family regulator